MSKLPSAPWPAPLTGDALYGLAGDVVRTLEPYTESDPVALLVQLLVSFGNLIGRGPHFRVEADRHALNLFAVLVGETSKARKGTSLGHVRRLLSDCELTWENSCIQNGLSSGEGLIHAVRDRLGNDVGVEDKRLLVVEPEFASVLRVMRRDGNTLSPVLRLAWDGRNLQIMTRQFPERATKAHISMIAHISKDELRSELTRTDAGSGFGNRFLWNAVRRSKLLPEGGMLPPGDLNQLSVNLERVVRFASTLGDFELKRDGGARELWHGVYPSLSEGKPGLYGAITSRAEAQVMRMACLYAVLDRSDVVKRQHLAAALAVWTYCAASALYIFRSSVGDQLADCILQALRAQPAGMTRTDLNNMLGRNRQGVHIDRALTLIQQLGLAYMKAETTGGRAAERWFAASPSSVGATLFSSNPSISSPAEATKDGPKRPRDRWKEGDTELTLPELNPPPGFGSTN